MHATQVQANMATHLIESVLGQAQQAQTDLALKMARVSLSQSLQSPAHTADVSGMGSQVDVVG
jgi:hypothetical protein